MLLGELHNGMEVDQGAVGFVHDRSSRDHAGKALATAHPLRVYNSEHLRRAVEQWRFKEWELIHIQPIVTQESAGVSALSQDTAQSNSHDSPVCLCSHPYAGTSGRLL